MQLMHHVQKAKRYANCHWIFATRKGMLRHIRQDCGDWVMKPRWHVEIRKTHGWLARHMKECRFMVALEASLNETNGRKQMIEVNTEKMGKNVGEKQQEDEPKSLSEQPLMTYWCSCLGCIKVLPNWKSLLQVVSLYVKMSANRRKGRRITVDKSVKKSNEDHTVWAQISIQENGLCTKTAKIVISNLAQVKDLSYEWSDRNILRVIRAVLKKIFGVKSLLKRSPSDWCGNSYAAYKDQKYN